MLVTPTFCVFRRDFGRRLTRRECDLRQSCRHNILRTEVGRHPVSEFPGQKKEVQVGCAVVVVVDLGQEQKAECPKGGRRT